MQRCADCAKRSLEKEGLHGPEHGQAYRLLSAREKFFERRKDSVHLHREKDLDKLVLRGGFFWVAHVQRPKASDKGFSARRLGVRPIEEHFTAGLRNISIQLPLDDVHNPYIRRVVRRTRRGFCCSPGFRAGGELVVPHCRTLIVRFASVLQREGPERSIELSNVLKTSDFSECQDRR